jgi:hypothetical protein
MVCMIKSLRDLTGLYSREHKTDMLKLTKHLKCKNVCREMSTPSKLSFNGPNRHYSKNISCFGNFFNKAGFNSSSHQSYRCVRAVKWDDSNEIRNCTAIY